MKNFLLILFSLSFIFIISCGDTIHNHYYGNDDINNKDDSDSTKIADDGQNQVQDEESVDEDVAVIPKGGEGEPCYDHSICDKLEDGTQLVCIDDICKKPDCETVDAREAGCLCGGETECMQGLVCLNGNCVKDSGQSVTPPESPKCYTPCKGGYLLDNESVVRKCSHEGLLEGCIGETECYKGSCVPSEEIILKNNDEVEAGTCDENTDCPSFQTCIDNRCYSDCESDDDCNDGRQCFKKVCRVPCNSEELTTENKICPDGEACVPLTDPSSGYCMPLSNEGSDESNDIVSTEDIESEFTVSDNTLKFTPRDIKRSLIFTNNTDYPRKIVVSKLSHTEYENGIASKIVENPLYWVHLGQYEDDLAQVQEIELIVPGNGGEVELVIGNVINETLTRWDGELKITSKGKPNKIVNLQYVGSPEGNWTGKAYYFANFGERFLDEWLADKDNSEKLRAVGNAFIRRWGAFKLGRISYDEFLAVMTATKLESWKWQSVKTKCPDEDNPNENAACYLYNNGKGLSIYSDYTPDNPIPTGVNDFDVTMHIREDPNSQDSKVWGGKILSSQSLQYNGDPEVSLQFATDPNECTSSPGAPCITFIDSFDFSVTVGARFITDGDNLDCYGRAGFEVLTMPWLVPGFTNNTTVDSQNRRYFHECRDTVLPYENSSLMKEFNKSLAAANPIPDGAQRRRDIQIIDGAMIDQEYMIIIFKEKFSSFWGDLDEKGFSAYGFMALNLSADSPKEDEYEGNQPANVNSASFIEGVSCSDSVKADLQMDVTEATANVAALALIDGVKPGSSDPQMLNSDNGYLYCNGELCEAVHYYCEDTNLFDGGKNDNGSSTGTKIECPSGSNIRFFTLVGKVEEVGQSAIAQLPCQLEVCQNIDVDGDGETDIDIKENCGCHKTFQEWQDNGTYYITLDPGFTCSNCNESRLDLRAGKEFYQTSNSNVVSLPADFDIKQAFRYKTKFKNRTGASVGFAPSVCIENSNMVPYCYDPEEIERIEEKMDCAIYIYTNYYDALENDNKAKLKEYLTNNFSYKETYVNGVSTPVIDDGFEDLYAELLVMLGDESFTEAFASRFDLAGMNLAPFEGSLLEPDGIDLEGAAGFEMYKLYQAAQYFQKALNRFYKLAPTMWKLNELPDGEGFLTPATVVTWFDSLTKASSKKARVWSEIAKRYQRFNRPDLARLVIERAYTATHLESIVLAKIMRKVITLSGSSYENQIVYQLETAQRIFRVAMIDMLNGYKDISDNVTYFGFAPDYLPFPVLEYTDKNPFLKHMIQANNDLQLAKEKEQKALDDNRSFESSSEEFQMELVKIEREYENQLMDICGSFTVETSGGQTLVYPAISKYAELHSMAKALGDPCGLMGNGEIADAITRLELSQLNIASIKQQKENLDADIADASARTAAQCSRIEKLEDLKIENQEEIDSLRTTNLVLQNNVGAIDRMSQHISTIVEMAKCGFVVGTSNGGDCAAALIGAGIINVTGAISMMATTVLDGLIAINEDKIMSYERANLSADILNECDSLKIDLVYTLKELYRRTLELDLEAMKLQKELMLAFSEIEKLRNKAYSLVEQMNETTELTINVEAARNDPNVRIYRNDTIIAADKTFYTALQQAYIATILYEYYTSQSYANKEQLFLTRMISYGDYPLELYLSDLQFAYQEFEYEYGLPQDRGIRLSLKDDIFSFPSINDDGTAVSDDDRKKMLRETLQDASYLDENGYITIPFSTNFNMVSPLTSSHKVESVEAKIVGTDVGDLSARVYVRQKGTGTIKTLNEGNLFYSLPQRTAVVEARIDSATTFNEDVYKNERLRGRPFINSNWELVLNMKDEEVNKDINLNSINDIYLFIYYSDFTGE